MKIELFYQNSANHKFWTIQVKNNEHIITYGEIGTEGTTEITSFSDTKEANGKAIKLAGAKIGEGYVKQSYEHSIVREQNVFAGKRIMNFYDTINPDKALRVFTDSYEADESIFEALDRLVKLKNIDQLENLIVGTWEEPFQKSPDLILEKLIEIKDKLASVKHLFIGDMDRDDCQISWIKQGDYSNFYQHFPDLESFGVKGGQDLKLGEIKLPKLKNLILETGGLDESVIRAINKSDLSNLEHLEIWIGSDEYGCTVTVDQLQPILDGKFPKLKYLGFKNCHFVDAMIVALKGAPVLKSIQTLDISMSGISDTGAQALFENDDLLKLEEINCRYHAISEEWMKKLKEKFSADCINLRDSDGVYIEISE